MLSNAAAAVGAPAAIAVAIPKPMLCAAQKSIPRPPAVLILSAYLATLEFLQLAKDVLALVLLPNPHSLILWLTSFIADNQNCNNEIICCNSPQENDHVLIGINLGCAKIA